MRVRRKAVNGFDSRSPRTGWKNTQIPPGTRANRKMETINFRLSATRFEVVSLGAAAFASSSASGRG